MSDEPNTMDHPNVRKLLLQIQSDVDQAVAPFLIDEIFSSEISPEFVAHLASRLLHPSILDSLSWVMWSVYFENNWVGAFRPGDEEMKRFIQALTQYVGQPLKGLKINGVVTPKRPIDLIRIGITVTSGALEKDET